MRVPVSLFVVLVVHWSTALRDLHLEQNQHHVKNNSADGFLKIVTKVHDNAHWHKHSRREGNHLQANGSLKIFKENLDFAFRLYKHISALPDSQSKNVFFSPLSVSVALAALSLGAGGKTHQQLFEGLGFNATEITAEEVNQAFLHIHENLNAKTDVDLSLGNALFIAQDFKLRPEFLESMKRYFQSEGFSTDFSNTEAAKEQINKYVDEKTKGEITDLVEGVDPATVMCLINYIYFKGKWDIPFDPKETKKDQFHVDDKTTVPVQMMYQEFGFLVFHDEESSADVLQLYFDDSVSMMLVLPEKGLKDLEEVVSRSHLEKWVRSVTRRKYRIYVPKLSLKSSYQLKEILSGMGITDIFEDTADFTGISEDEDLFVSKVIHEATLDMDEAGAKAAAATAVLMTTRSHSTRDPPGPVGLCKEPALRLGGSGKSGVPHGWSTGARTGVPLSTCSVSPRLPPLHYSNPILCPHTDCTWMSSRCVHSSTPLWNVALSVVLRLGCSFCQGAESLDLILLVPRLFLRVPAHVGHQLKGGAATYPPP
ncbi:hypothetical protein GJAV_G00023120 [Gymnothorax javanicus]|nr:hypothetical protein GJAV_G00023120 [Gymnothorax javanicus]